MDKASQKWSFATLDRQEEHQLEDSKFITQSEFVTACCTVTAVLADGVWHKFGPARVGDRDLSLSSGVAAMDVQAAAKYCGFGRTRFRELVDSGVFPRPVTIEGRKRWLAKDLDAALSKMAVDGPHRN